MKILKRKINNCIENALNVEEIDIPGLEDTFQEVEDPFEDLRTGWLQTEYIKKHLPFVVSCIPLKKIDTRRYNVPSKVYTGNSICNISKLLK